MFILNEKENEMGRLQIDLEFVQREREEKERVLMEVMVNIYVKEYELEENDIGENGMLYGELFKLYGLLLNLVIKKFLRYVNVKI